MQAFIVSVGERLIIKLYDSYGLEASGTWLHVDTVLVSKLVYGYKQTYVSDKKYG